ncbi:MAG: hypothetical protein GY942_20095 [Aestuariibacter sp.]|nr:hypothetical protein [Aestuariibacter sp.]
MDDGGSTQTTVQSNDPWSGVAPHLKQGYADARKLYDRGADEFYPGQTYTDANPLEHDANQFRLDYASNQLPGQISNAQNAQQSMLNAPDLANNPYVQDLAQRTNQRIGEDFNNNVMPGINAGAIGAGQMGSSRHGIVQGLAAGKAAQAMGDSTSRLYSDAYQAGLNQQAKGMAFTPQTANLGFLPADTMGSAGQFLRGETDMALQDDISRYNWDQGKDWTNLSRFLGAVGNAPWSSSQTASAQGQDNRLGTIGSLGMAGLGLGSSMGWF